MTTTIAELPQDLLQSVPQEQAQISPPPGDSSETVTVPDLTDSLHPSPNIDDAEARAEKKRLREQLCALGKTFGHIPDVPIFTQWDKRIECSSSAVHRSIIAGICGNKNDGAYSVSLSNMYKDNEDGGDVIIYTGAGGRERWSDATPPKRIRMGPQTQDQSWEHPSNKALIVSFLTGNPVRVIRSYRSISPYAPLKGYRYDGLYKVAAYWTAKGCNGKDICRCRLERLPDQPPIPLRPVTMPASRKRRERIVSGSTTSPSPSASTYDCARETCAVTRPSLPNVSGAAAGGLPNPQQQKDTLENSTGSMGDMEVDIKPPPPQSSRPQAVPQPKTMPRYRWDSKRNQLVRIPTANAVPDTDVTSEEEVRVADDATLVPSEDGNMQERMETEFYSDLGDDVQTFDSSF